jgi:biopolymer transport protein ExbD
MASKLTTASRQDLEDMKMDMSPMIDMVFLLLIFFIVASNLIRYRIDPNVLIPIADKASEAKGFDGRIIINIYDDGTFYDELSKPLDNEDAITAHVREKREQAEAGGIDESRIRIMIRAHKDAQVLHSKKVVRAGGLAGVNKVIFSSYPERPTGKGY